jgi:UDP-GlcNAc:undecaprenyl-phosphate GlcNAc-1-phosphate transferase
MNMHLLWIPTASFILCLILTPLARTLARRIGLVDGPDGRRKMQQKAVPVAGGLAILVSTTTVLGIALLLPRSGPEASSVEPGRLVGLLLAALIICGVGVADDYGYLRGRHKILGQFLAVLVVLLSGVQVRNVNLFSLEIELGLLSAPFTIFFLLGAINSLNLIDGMDGLLGTVALIVTGSFALLAILGKHWKAAWVALALAGAVLAFLRYNLPPASIYLGDSGSMLIGLVVGVLAIQSSLKSPATVALMTPLVLMTIPIVDTTAAILRRKLTGRSLYATDRGHIHHCLLHRGFSHWKVLLLVSSLCLVTVLGTLASLTYRNEMLALLSASVVVVVLVVTRLFGHVEFKLLQKRLTSIVLSLCRIPGSTTVKQVSMQLQGSNDWGSLWLRLTDRASELGLVFVRLDINAPAIQEGFHGRWDCGERLADDERLWRADIPLTAHGQVIGRVEFSSPKGQGCLVTKIDAVSKLISEIELAVSAHLVRREITVPEPSPDRNPVLAVSGRRRAAAAGELAITGHAGNP